MAGRGAAGPQPAEWPRTGSSRIWGAGQGASARAHSLRCAQGLTDSTVPPFVLPSVYSVVFPLLPVSSVKAGRARV